MITSEQVIKAYDINTKDNYFWAPCNYSPMLALFGEIVVQCDEDNYQGDTIAVVRNCDSYGYLTFGWGSCSGCDALQACGSVSEIVDLANDFQSAIKWFDSLQELKNFVNTHDYEGDWTDKDLVDSFKKELANI